MPESSSSARASEREDPELAAALDSFVDWARHGPGTAGIPGLPPLSIGQELVPGAVLGDYELVRRLGMGGMGVVFEARQRHVLGRRVALKVLRSAFATEDLALRFRREVAAIAGLDHPGIVPVVDARVEDGTPYYVMKFVEGMSAAVLIRELRNGPSVPAATESVRRFVEASARRERSDEPPSSADGLESSWEEPYPRWIARIGLQVAEALQYAHEHGFVHRDVKPGNVLITRRGRAVLVDFGLVTTAGDEALTRTGEFLGTLGYASPEQIRCQPLDARSDVYSLGATLHELLALERPFGNCTQSELLARIERDDPAPLGREIPADLRTIVGCALARSPARRYASAGAMAADLRAFLSGQPIRARPAGVVGRGWRGLRRHPRLLAAAAGIALALGGLRGLAHQHAHARVELGTRTLERTLGERVALERLIAAHEALLATRPRDHGRLMELRAAIRGAREGVASGRREARAHLEQAFEHVAGFGPAERGLARLAAEELRAALRSYGDVLDPEGLASLEAELARHDEHGEHARLLERQGSMSLASEPSGARFTILADGASEPLSEGRTPSGPLALAEGSYLALLEAEGRAPARLPFLVRRSACYDEPSAQPARELAVELLPAEDLPDGFVYVPAGETLVDDDPPRWERVESFLIARHEVTWRDVLARAHANSPAVLPDGEDPAWPVHGWSPMDMSAWCDSLDGRIAGAPADWIPSLPTVAEWMRAARGADGRPYPWGREFERTRCASYLSGPHFLKDARPLPSGSFSGDVSPFGVADLAGSVAEVTRDLHEPRPGEYVACGGSYRSADPAELRVTARCEDENDRPRQEVGFRVVLRPLPSWARPDPGPPEPLIDDFERPDSDDLGGEWIELADVPLGLETDPNHVERCSIERGRLVVRGGEGDFSQSSSAWHPIRVPESGYTVRAWIQATRTRADPPDVPVRRFGILLASGFRPSAREITSLTLGFDGSAVMRSGNAHDTVPASSIEALDPARPMLFELSRRADRLEGRIWPASEERPAEPMLELALPNLLPASFLGFEAPNLLGVEIEVDRVEVLCEDP